ncbi:MarR family winged helix-turn-helix transcriptional regulator [Ornithinimicrobium sp. INDO-MA30-4]|uniref:MarR family winged helix-turn-helix transcriptional regulator n=1 Tax=Ornithinimicrobium sp. INDO-MA30-4 TaxID=2908651 RepID=UPI001F41B517|nr:MarR family transcriptional regulator [Ornithinimicrobium sp. INDO-MA30-4]UJH70591.1 MarR family transcriptional regulator [Ornithinimicrobium sp. INDO-MA30-4]
MTSAGTPDEVDRIVAAWRRERSDLDVSPLEVFSRVSRLSRFLDLARKSAFATAGLEGWEFDVLSALRRSGDPYQLTAGALVRQTLVSSGTMTNRIDRLLKRGLVARSASAQDRRAVLIDLTPAGHDLIDAAMDALVLREQELLSKLSSEDQAQLASLLRTLVSP